MREKEQSSDRIVAASVIFESLAVIENELKRVREAVNDLANPCKVPKDIEEVMLQLFPVMTMFLMTERIISVFPSICDEIAKSLLTVGARKQANVDWSLAEEVLDARELEVLKLRRDSLTLDEIGKQFSLTRERIRQIEKKALRKAEGKKS